MVADRAAADLLVVVMGVAGCGKSTVGRALAAELDAAFLDADDLHDADRDVLRLHGATHVLHLTAAPEVLADRLARRTGHFMAAGMLDGQLAVLEPPIAEEGALTLDVTAAPPHAVAAVASRWIQQRPTNRPT